MTPLTEAELDRRVREIKAKILLLANDPLKERLIEFHVMSLITPLLDEMGADPAVIVGGHAVELYTSGSYRTADVDLVMVRDDLAKELFGRLGFFKEGKNYIVPELEIPIEIPHSRLAGSAERLVKLNTPDGYCYVIGVEDLIIDRLSQAEVWDDKRSLEWARYLTSSQWDDLDVGYLRERAGEEHPKLLERLEETLAWVEKNMPE